MVNLQDLKDMPEEEIRRNGEKAHDKDDIKKLVPCTDEALAMYRH